MVVALVAAGLLAPAAQAASTTQQQARAKALAALDVRRGTDPVIVFQEPKAIAGRTAITQAGPGSDSEARIAASVGARAAGIPKAARRGARVSTITAPVMARTGAEPVWLFYEDQRPYQEFEHPGRVVLVGVRTGRVTVTKTLTWPPLVAGRLPSFFRSYAAYRAAKYRAYARSWRLKRGAALTSPARTTGAVASVLPSYARLAAADAGASQARLQAAGALAAEHSCAIRVSDTLGDFYDVGPVDRTRAALGALFNELSRLNPGFFTTRYTARAAVTPAAFIDAAIAKHGCRDVLLYLAGGGYRATKDPAVNVGTLPVRGGKVEQQLITASALRATMRRHPHVTFKVEIDAPSSGAFLAQLQRAPNLLVFAASGGAGEGSFTALSDVQDANGTPVANRYNAGQYLEFTNRQLRGLTCFLSSPDEVSTAAQATAAGTAPSFLAAMLARAFSLCAADSLADHVVGGPTPLLRTFGFSIPSGPDVPPPGPPVAVNHAPVAANVAVRTREDTPVSVPLSGTDADGDPLTYALATAPGQGVVSGSGATWTYTPNPNANGSDSFTYTVSDGTRTSAPATVSITIDPVDDAPVVTLGSGATTFTEGGAPVAVDPGVTVSDVDDATLASASVTLGGGVTAGEDELLFTGQNGIVGSYSAVTGTLTLTGSATVADYQTALRSVRFRTPSANPSATPRTATIQVSDGTLLSTAVVRPIAMTLVNDPPVLGGGAATATFTEDDPVGVVVDGGLTAFDVDSATLAGATVRITAGLAAGEDELLFTAQSGITGRYDAATGTLTLAGSASPAAYQAALRSVRYRNTNTGDPSAAPRTVAFQVNDGASANAASNVITVAVTVTPVDDAPTVTAGGSVTYTEGDAATVVAPGLIAADVDNATFTGATVSIVGGLHSGEDVLAFTNQNGITGTFDGATGVLTLTGTATKAEYQAALRSVTYANAAGENPTGGTRTVAFAVSDGSLSSAAATTTVTVVPVNDAPVLGGGPGAATYTEDDPTGVVVHGAITVSDLDSPTLAGATVAITAGLAPTEDRLTFTDTTAITGTYDAATGVLTLRGAATPAQYQAALRSVRYVNANTGDPSTAPRTVAFTVDDGAAEHATSAALTATVTVVAVDDAPTLTSGSTVVTYTEDDPPVTVDPTIAVGDVDSPILVGATVAITGGFQSGEDVLALTAQGGISGSYDANTGILTLTGPATPAQYQAALRSITYRDANGATPATATRTIAFRVDDGALTSNTTTTSVTVVAVDDPPVVTTSSGGASFVEAGTGVAGSGPVAVDPALTLVDVDNTTLTGATVAIEPLTFHAGEDSLGFTDQNGIHGSYDAATGALSLTGTATVADYQAALRSVTYDNSSESPSALDRTVSFTATDGTVTGLAATRTVTVTPSDDAPVVTLSGSSPTYLEASAPTTIDGGLTVTDVDSASLASATVCICSGRDANDTLVSTATNGITATAYDPATGSITLTGSGATPADFQAALRTVAFRNTGASPSTAPRGITVTVNDGTLDSTAVTKTLTVTRLNVHPTLGGGGTTLAYTEDDPATAVNGTLTVTDPDGTHMAGATVAITGGFVSGEDVLGFTSQNGISGSYAASTGVLTLSGSATNADYQAALRSVTYVNTNHAAPASANRTVSFTVNDGHDDSAPATTTITVAQRPDAPVLTAGTGPTPTFTENGSAVLVDDGIALSDVDSTTMSGATVSITAGRATGDVLGFTSVGGLSGSFDAATGVLTITGSASVADYQTALRSVTYASTSDDPGTARTISFTVTDDTAMASTAVTRAVAVHPVNDAPTVSGGGTLHYTENDPATAISPSLTLADVDSQNLTGAVVKISAGYDAGKDVLGFTSQSGITGVYDAGSGVLTLSGTATVAQYRTALRSVTFVNTSDNPSGGLRVVTYTVTDDGSPAGTGSTTATVDVTPVDDAPTAVPQTFSGASSAVPNTTLTVGTQANPAGQAAKHVSGSLTAGAADAEGDPISTVPGTFATANGGSVTIDATGGFVFTPVAGSTATDTFTFRTTDGTLQSPATTATIAMGSTRVWYVRNNATAAGANGTSARPFTSLSAAAAAAATGDRIYVFQGDGTSGGLNGGVSLQAGQQLLGQADDLVVGSDTLFVGAPTSRPSIGGTVSLDSGNTVQGLTIDGGATGAAITGGSGDAGGTLNDLRVTGAVGGVSLNGTSGTWTVTDTAITTAGDGFTAINAGTVAFTSTGTNSIVSSAGRAVTISNTATSGTIDQATATASPTTGVSLTGTTGWLNLSSVSLITAGTGLQIDGANAVLVSGGTVTSAGTAVDLNTDHGTPASPPNVTLTSATSTGGANGIRISNNGSGSFTAGSGSLTGNTTADIAISGGSGTISYGGTLGDGSGLSASITGRTGGAITLSGNITDGSDAGGGISMSGNSGGSTTFSGATKTLSTGASPAVSLAFTGGHAVSFTNGGLAITTTSGAGLTATGTVGTVAVTGAGNSVTSATGTAVSINGPDIDAAGVTFQSIASSGAASGIVLADTGTAGTFAVTGAATANSGGQITGSTGPGVSLSNTGPVSLNRMAISGGSDDGIRGATVNGFAMANSSVTDNGNAAGESGLDFTQLSGSSGNPVTLTDTTVSGSFDSNVHVVNSGAVSLGSFTILRGTYAGAGNDGVLLESNGSGGTLTASITGATFSNNRGDHIQLTTDGSSTATQRLTVDGDTLTGTGNQPGNTTLGGGITINPSGSGTTTAFITNTRITRARDSAIVLNTPNPSSRTLNAYVNGNTIGTSGEPSSGSATGDGVYANIHGSSTANVQISNNTIQAYANAFGIDLAVTDGSAIANATIRANTIQQSDPGALGGMRLLVGADDGDNGSSCLDVGGAGVLANSLAGTGIGGYADLRFSMDGDATARLVGYTGGAHDTAAAGAYLAARSNRNGAPTVDATQFDTDSNYANATSCPTPPTS